MPTSLPSGTRARPTERGVRGPGTGAAAPLLRYFARRLLFSALLVVLVSSGALLLARAAPGDFTTELIGSPLSAEAIERERTRLGLDRPILEQYGHWARRMLRLDLGTSFRYGRPVLDLVRERAANSAVLALAALALATLIGLPLGVLTGSRRGGAVVGLVRGASVVGLSVPPLLTSLLFALLAARTGWFPIGGMGDGAPETAGLAASARALVWHLTLPALALALPLAAMLERLQAAAMAEALGQPFIRAALARGVPVSRLVWRHGLRVAAPPVVAVYGVIVGTLLSGSFIVEIVMSWPGLGRLMYEALISRDVYLVAGCAAAGALFLAAGTFLSDVALAAVDPRLRQQEAGG